MRYDWVCAIAGAAMVLASTTGRADEIAESRELLRQGQAARAYGLLEPLEAQRAGNVDFDYALGIAAYDAGRFDRAVIAFERVLDASPQFKSARFDLGRAYFVLGADDLARQEFERLLASGPTAEGERAIREHLEAIERRKAGPQRRWRVFLEAGGGHDSNLSSTTPDFTGAIDAAFGIPNVLPTGNSILRSSTFLSLAGGVSGSIPLAASLEVVGSLELRARDYGRYGEFDYRLADAQLGLAWRNNRGSIQAVATGQGYRQDGATPVALDGRVTTSNRNSAGINIEARRFLSNTWEAFGALQWSRLRYPDNASQDTNQAYGTVGVLHATADPWPGLVLVSVFHSVDRAQGPINDVAPEVDVGRTTSGVRAYLQRDLPRSIYAWTLVSWSRRVDDSAFARSNTVETGRDRLAEVSTGVVVPWGRWSLRPSVTYLRNRSNIALYDFSKTEGSLLVRYEFP